MRRNVLLWGALTVVGLSAAMVAQAEINREFSEDYYYYDANGVIVGHLEVPCTGRVRMTGTQTADFTVVTEPCPYVPIPPDYPDPPWPNHG